MNIEDLSKSQLLLLTILVNFVTAIATAVLTVSLLDESPANITQTVNRIVDHTIETVTTAAPATGGQQSGTRDEELLTAAVAADAARIVYVYRGGEDTTKAPVARGVYLPASRAIATSRTIALPKEIVVKFADGSTAEASLASNDDSVGVYGFSDTAVLPKGPAANPIAAADLKPGQTVIATAADGSVVTGIVSKVDTSGIYTTLPAVPPGAGVVSLSSSLIGISAGTPGAFISTDRIMALLTPTP